MENLFNLNYTPKLKAEFKTLATWANITAIIGFVNAGITLIAAVMVGNIGSSLVSVAISVALNIYLFKFAKSMKLGVETTNQHETNDALHNLKTYFMVYGILMIIVLTFFVIVMAFGFSYIVEYIQRGRF